MSGFRPFSRSNNGAYAMPLTKDSREFIERLHSNKVEFLIVGALAVSWHGFLGYSWSSSERAELDPESNDLTGY
jgi:hypothetical protein